MFKQLILGAALTVAAWGAEVHLRVQPPIISLGETAQLIVEVRDAKHPTSPRFPSIDGLRFSGTSQSKQVQIINGSIDSSISYSTTIYPQRTGTFQIGPFRYSADGQSHELASQLEVVTATDDASSAQSWSDLVFAKLTANREQAFVQEPFELTLLIYSRADLQLTQNINLQGLPKTGLSDPQWTSVGGLHREQIDGTLYNVRRFKSAVRPIGSGTFEFKPTVSVQVVDPRARRDAPFGFGLFDTTPTIPVDLPIQPLLIQINPLPSEGKPPDFSGAVGQFEFRVSASPTTVSPGDPITLQMAVVGTGNRDQIQSPTLPASAPFRLFGDAVRQPIQNGIQFERVITPRDATVGEIPPIEFSFFDSAAKRYRTIRSRPIALSVTESTNQTAKLFITPEKNERELDETPFASESDLQRIAQWLRTQWKQIRPWLWILPVALGVGALLYGIQKWIHIRRKDIAWMRRQQAPKAARRALKRADHALREHDFEAFYEAIGCALSAYFGNRLNLAPGDVTPTIVLKALEATEADAQTARSIFNRVDAARYGQLDLQSSESAAKTLKKETAALLRAVEKIKAL